ncbi:hypothetical protein [Sphingobium fluviale]
MTPLSLSLFSGLALMASVPTDNSLRSGVGSGRVAADSAGQGSAQWAQMTIEQRVIIRVPMVRRPPPQRADIEWEERKGPKCIDLKRLRFAAVTSERGVDLMLAGRERMRALLGRECGPADLHSGLYVQPNEDGALCAGRDRVLSRSGADCPIRKLVRLVPEDDD